MFDKTVLAVGGGRTEHHHNHDVDVTVNRAPTDESVRLLKEMEAAAREKMYGRYETEGNALRARWFTERDDLNDKTRVRIQYQLNGKMSNLDLSEPREITPEQLRDAVLAAVSQHMATVLTHAIFTATHRLLPDVEAL